MDWKNKLVVRLHAISRMVSNDEITQAEVIRLLRLTSHEVQTDLLDNHINSTSVVVEKVNMSKLATYVTQDVMYEFTIQGKDPGIMFNNPATMSVESSDMQKGKKTPMLMKRQR